MDYVFLDKNIEPLVSEFEGRFTVGLDIETSGLLPMDSRMLLAQFGFIDKIYVVNTGKVSLDPILPFIQNPKWTKLIHNASFEASFFQYLYKTDIKGIFDTYLAELMLDYDARHDLASVALKYTGKVLNKSIRDTFHSMNPQSLFTEDQLQYAADDVFVLFETQEKQKAALEEQGMLKLAEIEFELANVVAAMRLAGMPIDTKKWRDQLTVFMDDHEKSRLKMNELIFDESDIPEQMGLFVRDGINLNSQPQIKTSLKSLGIKLPTNVKGKESTDERALSLIDHPVAKELLNYRGLQKVASSYGDSLLEKIHPFTGRLHPDFQQIGTATGRFSCREPNVQQIPGNFRECVMLEGHKIVAADYSQMELRILAQLSGDQLFTDALIAGIDLHKSTASIMFNISLDSVDKEKRFIAKTLNFGITYGMGINKLKDMLNAEAEKHGWEPYSFERAKDLLNQYKNTYVTATNWLRKTGEDAYRKGYCTTLMGRRRRFVRPYNLEEEEMSKRISSLKRQGANTPVQGSNADITKLAMVNLYDDIKKFGFRAEIINQVHDEIVVLAHTSQAEAIKDMMIESMTESAKAVLVAVPVKVDATISDFWYKG